MWVVASGISAGTLYGSTQCIIVPCILKGLSLDWIRTGQDRSDDDGSNRTRATKCFILMNQTVARW